MSLVAEKERTVIESMKMTVGDDTFEVPTLRELTFWYPQWASGYNDASNKSSLSFKTDQITADIKLEELRSLTVNKSNQAVLVLKSGDSYTGSLQAENGKPLAIVGKIDKGYEGFPAEGCFLLSEIASLAFAEAPPSNPAIRH